MKLKVLGSSSVGNCYILENDDEALIIEAGISLKEVKKSLNFNVRKIVGVICTHRHSDHAKYCIEYKKVGISVFKPYEFSDISADTMHDEQYGNFKIRAFPNRSKDGHWFHGNSDGTECPCYGFHIYHPDMGNTIYVSDTELVRWRFSNTFHILCECNYCKDLIQDDAVNRMHVMTGHMELETTLQFIDTNANSLLQNVILLHLSDENSDEELFLKKAKETMKYGTNVYIASKGLEVNLNLYPF